MVNNTIAYEGAVYRSIKEAVKITGLSEYYFKQNLKAGKIPHIRNGNKIFINIPRLLAELEKVTDTSLVNL
ncbi:MAG: hypothetical protein LKF32_01715 [Mageeibacillus sp.]|jgi:hypothetical protein|nr:hypothetical protein [Mageeibacillus sp.]